MCPRKFFLEKIRLKLNRQAWRSYGVAYGRGYPGYYHSSYYPGSHSWAPPGGGTASDFKNHGGGSAHSGGAGSTGGGGAYVGAPEGSSSGSPSKPRFRIYALSQADRPCLVRWTWRVLPREIVTRPTGRLGPARCLRSGRNPAAASREYPCTRYQAGYRANARRRNQANARAN